MTTLTRTREQWERKETADWWSAGQARTAANLSELQRR